MKNIISVALISLGAAANALFIPIHDGAPAKIAARDNTCSSYGSLPTLDTDANGVFTAPAGMYVKIVAHGMGNQNYTCGDDNKYTSAGAVATLYDMCGGQGTGHHYFQPNPTNSGAISPVFDFRTGQGDMDDTSKYAFAKVDDTITPDTGSENVAWLKLSALDTNQYGSLANVVFRVNTNGGAAPATCDTPGTGYSVPYQADYWFYSSS